MAEILHLELGQRVVFRDELQRSISWTPGDQFDVKTWCVRAGEERHGVIVGIRNLSNGKRFYNDGVTFEPTGYMRAYLVAYDMRRKPVYVRPEDVFTEDG